jgi:heme O synthase-like polyprenyltransferase
MSAIIRKITLYIPLIKSTQTGLLLSTGIAGYLSAGTRIDLFTLIGLSASLFLAISGFR